MADKAGLQTIGWTFGGITVAVMLIASVIVSDAMGTSPETDPQPVIAALQGR